MNINKIKYIVLILLSFCLGFAQVQAQTLDVVAKDGFKKVFEEISTSKKTHKRVKVLHIGDSHITGGFTSKPIAEALHHKYGTNVWLEHYGIPGATFETFSHTEVLDKVTAYNADLIIISLGTNDSYNTRFSAEKMTFDMKVFFKLLRSRMPETAVILTTPPASYLPTKKRIRRCRYKTTYHYNKYTLMATNIIKYVALGQKNCAVIDLYHRLGSEGTAEQWLRKGLMRQDHVHYSVSGYHLLGEEIARLLILFIEQKYNAEEETQKLTLTK